MTKKPSLKWNRLTHSERVGFQILAIAVISGAVGAAIIWLLIAWT